MPQEPGSRRFDGYSPQQYDLSHTLNFTQLLAARGKNLIAFSSVRSDIKAVVEPMGAAFTKSFIHDPEGFKTKVLSYKQAVERDGDTLMTPVEFTARTITDVIVPEMMTKATNAYNKRDMKQFVLMVDAIAGIYAGLAGLSVLQEAENHVFHIKAQYVNPVIGEFYPNFQATDTMQAEVDKKREGMLARAQVLIADDPTGKSVIEDTIAALLEEAKQRPEDRHVLRPPVHPDIVIAGARVAQRLYSVIYPLVDQVFTS